VEPYLQLNGSITQWRDNCGTLTVACASIYAPHLRRFGLGRAKFTDGNPVAFELRSDGSLERNPQVAAGVQRNSSALENRIHVAGDGPADYLRCFFSELERLKHLSICDVSHAIDFRDGKLYVLMSIGDLRERVYVQDLDKDPVKFRASEN
jgi:hypothetical protein